MAGHKLYLKYVQPVVSGIDGVFSLLEGIDVLKCFVPDLREHYNDCPITSLPTVTEEVLQKLLKPNSFEYVLKTSKVLEIESPKLVISVYTIFEIGGYVAVIKSGRKVSAKVLGYYNTRKFKPGTHALFDLLKKRHMISAECEEIQPDRLDVLDFDELADWLSGFLEPGVTLTVKHRLPTYEELDGKHTTWYNDGSALSPIYIEIVNVSCECFVIYAMVNYENKDEYSSLAKSHGFQAYESAFCDSGVFEELFYTD